MGILLHKISPRKPYVLSFLMHVSKLQKHPVASYYREIVKHTLEDGKIHLIGHPLPSGYRQEFYHQYATELCARIQAIRKNCVERVRAYQRKKRSYDRSKECELQQAVTNRLLNLYLIFPTSGDLSMLEGLVIASLTDGSSFDLDLVDSESYYQEQHEKMIKYNRMCSSSSQRSF